MNPVTHNVALELSQLLYSYEVHSENILWNVVFPILEKVHGSVTSELLQNRVWEEICVPRMAILKNDYVKEYSHDLRQFFSEAQITAMVKECKEYSYVQGWRSSFVLSMCYFSALQKLKSLMVENAEAMADSIEFEINQLLSENINKKKV